MKLWYQWFLLASCVVVIVIRQPIPIEGGLTPGMSFSELEGRFKLVSVGRAGVWAINANNQVYYRENTYGNENDAGDSWMLVDGQGLIQVDVGKNIVWGVSSTRDVFYRRGIGRSHPMGAMWVKVAGSLKHVTVSQKGHVWGISETEVVYHRIGASKCNRAGDSWSQIGGTLMKQISVGSSGVWGVSSADYIFYREGTYGDPDSDPDGLNWVIVDGGLKYITSADRIYGVNYQNLIYFRVGVSAANPRGSRWQQIAGSLNQVDSLSLTIWGTTNTNYIFVKRTD
ncbi:perivitellin-2 31 kDa subunit-like [Asterias amurensis]|uniref:perivitellin-2 31 kDa subunit-like n=1 Tax=Asterias amurensis TaxID=7602 RepID=UPI003AB201A2